MSRQRTVKAEFFNNEQLGAVSPLARLLFIGLWTEADREGRLKDQPLRLKGKLFPFDESITRDTIDGWLTELAMVGVIVRYTAEIDGEPTPLVWVVNFARHQHPHPHEVKSVLPPCERRKAPRPTHPEVSAGQFIESGRVSPLTRPVSTGQKRGDSSIQEPDQGCEASKTGPDLNCRDKSRPAVTSRDMVVPCPAGSSGSSGSSFRDRTQERSQGGESSSVDVRPPPPPVFGGTLHGGSHRSHAACGRVCTPDFIHAELRRLKGGAEDEADRWLRQWYRRVLDSWPEDRPIGDRPEKFWYARWQEEFGTTQKSTGEIRKQQATKEWEDYKQRKGIRSGQP